MKVTSVSVRAALVVGSAAAAAALAITPSQAATGYARCPAGKLCVFSGTNGSGVIGIFSTGDVDLGAAPGPSGLNNNIESVWNRSSSNFAFYPERNYNGGSADGISELVPRTAKATFYPKFRNTTSSIKKLG
ncbi:MAG: hypothetical protein EON52_27020 [Actinomycetales bacterium]|nr:MAG: hypothetical protein EON52_27020 [Actinomycetales bacterium]